MTEKYTHRITEYICLKNLLNIYIYDLNSVFCSYMDLQGSFTWHKE